MGDKRSRYPDPSKLGSPSRPYDLRALAEPPLPAPRLPVGARVPHGGVAPEVRAHYPDPQARAPREAAARAWDVDVARIVFGAGSSELLQATCQALLRAKDLVLVAMPTFGEYARAARLAGASVRQVAPRDGGIALDLDAVERMLHDDEPRMIVLCSPNNATGERLDRARLAAIADACATRGTWLVLDQTYDPFLEHPDGTPLLGEHPVVLHLRSLTKEHGLASVRTGFLVAPPHVVEAVETVRAPWATGTLAQATAVASLAPDATAHVAQTVARLRGERVRLARECARLGLAVHEGETHTLLLDVGDGDAARLALLRSDAVHVRAGRGFGLPRHVRVSARTPHENDRLLAALAGFVAGRGS